MVATTADKTKKIINRKKERILGTFVAIMLGLFLYFFLKDGKMKNGRRADNEIPITIIVAIGCGVCLLVSIAGLIEALS